MIFLDANVFVYLIDDRDLSKQRRARSIIADALGRSCYVISAQVLNEFANVAVKKFGFPIDEVRQCVENFQVIRTVDQKASWTDRALTIKEQYGTQFYDSLLLAAAEANGCDEFWTEDLNDGQRYCGIKAVNPFKGKE